VDPDRTHVLKREQWLPLPIEEVFEFFGDAMNLQAITPRWLHFSVVTPAPIVMEAGTVIDYWLRWHALPIRWTTLIEVGRVGDRQVRGSDQLVGCRRHVKPRGQLSEECAVRLRQLDQHIDQLRLLPPRQRLA
jgi:hypothetical protein